MSVLAVAVAVLGGVAGAFLIAVMVVAFIQAFRDTKLDTITQAAWFLLIVFVPVVGAVAWFIVDEHRAHAIFDRLRWSLPQR